MNSNFWKAAGAVLAGIAFHASADAQTMYRCGKQYQDRPCDAGQQGRAVGSATSSQSAATAASDADCAQRGSDAVKIVWAREGGATAERLLSDIGAKSISASRKAEESKLVQDVYRQRGTAPEVRARIEAECVAEKEKAAQAAALAAAAAKLMGGSQSAAPAAVPAAGAVSSSSSGSTGAVPGQDDAARAAENLARLCARLSGDLELNRSKQRAGGNVGTMESLNNQRRDIESRMSSAGC